MPQPVSTKDTPSLFYFVAIAALTADIAAMCLIDLNEGIWRAAGLHLCAIALVGSWTYFSQHRHDRERFSIFLLPMLMAAGPFGVVICLIASLTHALCVPNAQNPSDWIESMFEREPDSEGARLFERIAQGLDAIEEAEKVEPFSDILIGGTVLQKQMAVAKIARYFRPQFAPLLLQAANDPNAAVRVQAATALAKIERDFMTRYIRLENTLKALPDSDPKKLKLAELYDDYAYTGLLDENNQQSLRTKAIEIYEACVQTQPDNQEWRIRLARLYLRQKQPLEAHRCLSPLMKSPNVSRAVVNWYMEILFALKQYDELRTLADSDIAALKQPMNDNILFDKIADAPGVWQGNKSTASGGNSTGIKYVL